MELDYGGETVRDKLLTNICGTDIWLPKHRHDAVPWDIWEKERLAALKRNIRSGDVLYDVGAEQGDMTCLFALWGAKVVPIEPNPYFWPTIRQIFLMNGIDHPYSAFAGFASNRDERPTDLLESPFAMKDKEHWPGCAFMEIEQTNDFRNMLERSHDTPQIEIDTQHVIMGPHDGKENAPDIINIDVEGAEWEVLKGAIWNLENKKPLVFVSVHPAFMENDYGYTKYDLYIWMKDLGYEMEVIAVDHEEHTVFWHPEGKKYVR